MRSITRRSTPRPHPTVGGKPAHHKNHNGCERKGRLPHVRHRDWRANSASSHLLPWDQLNATTIKSGNPESITNTIVVFKMIVCDQTHADSHDIHPPTHWHRRTRTRTHTHTHTHTILEGTTKALVGKRRLLVSSSHVTLLRLEPRPLDGWVVQFIIRIHQLFAIDEELEPRRQGRLRCRVVGETRRADWKGG